MDSLLLLLIGFVIGEYLTLVVIFKILETDMQRDDLYLLSDYIKKKIGK